MSQPARELTNEAAGQEILRHIGAMVRPILIVIFSTKEINLKCELKGE